MTTRAGIIGLGRIGHGFGVDPNGDPLSHSAAYAQLPEVELVLGVDPDPEARADFQRRFPSARVYPDLTMVPGELRLDVVSICTPTELHAAGVMAALAWEPRVILCEKPLAPSAAEAERLVAACAARGCTLMVNYSRRWTPLLRVLQELVGPGGALGAPLGASLRYNGGLLHNGTHWIDLLLALFGPDATPVSLGLPGHPGPGPAQATAAQPADPPQSVALTWPGGFTAHLLATGHPGYAIGEGEIWGLGGLVRFEQAGQRVMFYRAGSSPWAGFRSLGEPETLCTAGLRGHMLNAVTEAVHLCRTGGAPACSGADGLRALRMVEMVRKGGSPAT